MRKHSWSSEDWHTALTDLIARLREDAGRLEARALLPIDLGHDVRGALAYAHLSQGRSVGLGDASSRIMDLLKRASEGSTVLPPTTIAEARENAALAQVAPPEGGGS